ncbi:exosome-associated protein 2, putative [Bodo saltans]|uniref:Ribosomal RNA-processing protein 43 n=1 Tax=Bodo saltans TaxID=75058 RepID=A0A0S4J9X0_BODSA|nr:exosome-associated protein 2, putative [Bodo saltans]|eukprot:CUG88260.1 exosome-associated protein 2, putative [Bodo saltans]
MSLFSTGNVEPQAYHQQTVELLQQSKRRDGRDASTLRRTTTQSEVSNTSLGSATASIGGSVAQCTVRGCFGPPTAEAPNAGRLDVLVEAPFASPHLDSTQDARKALSVFLRDVLRSTLSTAPLSVVPGEACWVLSVDVTILAADGSLRSLCLAAVVAALQRIVLPRARLPNGDYTNEVLWGYCTSPVLPVAVTCAQIQGTVLLDVTSSEESIADALVTIVFDERSLATAPSILYTAHHGGYPTGGAKALEAIAAAVAQSRASHS